MLFFPFYSVDVYIKVFRVVFPDDATEHFPNRVERPDGRVFHTPNQIGDYHLFPRHNVTDSNNTDIRLYYRINSFYKRFKEELLIYSLTSHILRQNNYPTR